MLYQLMTISGAILVLIAFAGLQMGKMDRTDRWFNIFNFVGSLLLGPTAVHDRRWGFIGLEFIWAAFCIPPLLHKNPAK